MGYYTRYELEIHADGKKYIDISDAQEKIKNIVDYDPFQDSCKWYDHEHDMKALSKEYPDTIFTLVGEGEEAGDLWKKYFKNGKVQVCKAVVTYPECTL